MQLLLDLLKAYVTSGWMFGVVHLGLIGYIARRLQRIRREALLLEEWEPASSEEGAEDRPESIQTLDRFVKECRGLGPQGFFVPLGDFSDRLDSVIEGRLSDVYNWINMLLVVGIAGSLFGLFEFALYSSDELLILGSGRVDPGQFSELLSASMAKAFPVGFVGLALMVGLQALASRPEERLRRGASLAIGRAAEERLRVSRSQGEIVRQAVGEIGKAMQPLENLESTLQNSIRPVVEEFGTQMKESHKYFRQQFDDLRGATDAITGAVEGIQANVSILEQASTLLGETLGVAPKVLQKTAEVQESHLETLKSFESLLEESRSSLNGSIDDFAGRLERLITAYRGALVDTQKEITEAAVSAVSEAQVRVDQSMDSLDSLLARSAESHEVHLSSVGAALGVIQTRGQAVLTGLEEEIRQLISQITGETQFALKGSLDDLKTRIDLILAAYREGMTQTQERVGTAVESSIQATEEQVADLVSSLKSLLQQIGEGQETHLETLESSLIRFSSGSEEVIDSLALKTQTSLEQTLEALASRAQTESREVLGEVKESVRAAAALAKTAERSLGSLESMPKELQAGIREAMGELQEGLHAQVDGLVSAAAGRIEQNQELMDALSAKLPELQILIQSFLENTQSTADRLADEVVGKWLEVSEGFSGNLIRATDSLERLAEIPSHTEREISGTLGIVQTQLNESLTGTWDSMLTTTQTKVLSQLDALQHGAEDIGTDLVEAAAEWHRTAREVGDTSRTSIVGVIESVRGEVVEALLEVGSGMRQSLQGVLENLENVAEKTSTLVKAQEAAINRLSDFHTESRNLSAVGPSDDSSGTETGFVHQVDGEAGENQEVLPDLSPDAKPEQSSSEALGLWGRFCEWLRN